MSNTIERVLPSKKPRIECSLDRYDESVFDAYKEFTNNEYRYKAYLQWKSGVNPKTGKRMVIGGHNHNKMKRDFAISYTQKKGNRTITRQCMPDDIEGIDVDAYLQETAKLNADLQSANFEVTIYNEAVQALHEAIESQSMAWGDSITFDGVKYGVGIVCNGIHMQENCGGKLVLRESTHKECSKCMLGTCNAECARSICTEEIYRCDKCEYVRKVRGVHLS